MNVLKYEVAYRVLSRNGTISTKRKSFSSENSRDRFIEKLEANGTLLEVVGYRDPNPPIRIETGKEENR